MQNTQENTTRCQLQSIFKKDVSPQHVSDDEKIQMIQDTIDAGVDAYICYHQKQALDNAVMEGVNVSRKFYISIDGKYQEKMKQYRDLFSTFHQRFDSAFMTKELSWQIAHTYLEQLYEHMPDAKKFEMSLYAYFDEKFYFSSLGTSSAKPNL